MFFSLVVVKYEEKSHTLLLKAIETIKIVKYKKNLKFGK